MLGCCRAVLAQWSERRQLRLEALGSIPSGYPCIFSFSCFCPDLPPVAYHQFLPPVVDDQCSYKNNYADTTFSDTPYMSELHTYTCVVQVCTLSYHHLYMHHSQVTAVYTYVYYIPASTLLLHSMCIYYGRYLPCLAYAVVCEKIHAPSLLCGLIINSVSKRIRNDYQSLLSYSSKVL